MEPVVEDGIQYWTTQPASMDGVLGGFGTGSLPRVDALGSRQFLMQLRPELCTVPSSLHSLDRPSEPPQRWRAVDVGAGIGRVTRDVLLHLVHDVVLLEPTPNFIQEAICISRSSPSPAHPTWKGIAEKSKSVTFLEGTLQSFDPSDINFGHSKYLDRVGHIPDATSPTSDLSLGFDVVWCQWCLGHLNNTDLVVFLKRCKKSLKDEKALIVVKENLCSDDEDGKGCIVFDEQDSSLTRSDTVWKECFQEAGLVLIDERVQEGLPAGLYVVKTYALR